MHQYTQQQRHPSTPPTAQLKFNTKFVDDVLEWKEIYSLPFRATLDTKSREFQCKLLNRCLVTNAFLFKVELASTPACSFCGEIFEEVRTLEPPILKKKLFRSQTATDIICRVPC